MSSASTGYNWVGGSDNLYTVGAHVIQPDSQLPTVDKNVGKEVTNEGTQNENVWQLVCASSADCGSNLEGPSGFYCVNKKCVLCPFTNSQCGEVEAGEVEACKNDCAAYHDLTKGKPCEATKINEGCTLGDPAGITSTLGNDGWFCRVIPDPNGANSISGKCTRCQYINTDVKGRADQCSAYKWQDPNSVLVCQMACERWESAVETTSITASPITAGVSLIEDKFGGTNGLDPPFCARTTPTNAKDYCETDLSNLPADHSFLPNWVATLTAPEYQAELMCNTRKCSNENKCVLEHKTNNTPCVTKKKNGSGDEVMVAGICESGTCIVTLNVECPEGYTQTLQAMPSCVSKGFNSENPESAFSGYLTNIGETIEHQVQSLICLIDTQWNGNDNPSDAYNQQKKDANSPLYPMFFDPNDNSKPVTTPDSNAALGSCIVGNKDSGYADCPISTAGSYLYRNMRMDYVEQEAYQLPAPGRAQNRNYVLFIAVTTRDIKPVVRCPPGQLCFGGLSCQYEIVLNSQNPGEQFPCGGQYNTCEKISTTLASSHGDPIIWTFHDECYDLNMDGKYVASAHPNYDHQINIVVYNDYMREIEVVNRKGDVLLSINVDGEYEAENYPYAFEVYEKECPENMKKNECLDSYMSFRFDAQEFQYFVHILRHDYKDPSLKEGELGYHLDIYPTPYDRFYHRGHKEKYTGLYFENPLPEKLEYCAGGSPKRV